MDKGRDKVYYRKAVSFVDSQTNLSLLNQQTRSIKPSSPGERLNGRREATPPPPALLLGPPSNLCGPLQRPRSRSVYTSKAHHVAAHSEINLAAMASQHPALHSHTGSAHHLLSSSASTSCLGLRDSKSYDCCSIVGGGLGGVGAGISVNGVSGLVPTWLARNGSHHKNIYIDDYLPETNGYHTDLADTSPISVSPFGVITLRLHDRVRVDISLDRAVRIINVRSGIVLALSSSGSSAALIHPNGRVFQYGSRVEILANDPQGNNKYAKMWYKGVSFTSDQCALVYLVDSAGTRTTTDTFSDLNADFSIGVFCSESPYCTGPPSPGLGLHCVDSTGSLNGTSMLTAAPVIGSVLSGPVGGQNLTNEGMIVLQGSTCWISDDGTTNWLINNVRVSQTTDGLVRVGRNSNKFSLHTSPTNGSARISSPFLHCTGSMGQTRHLFVRRGERRMHYDGASFIVRNAGHSAGFDDKHQLKVY